MDDRLDTFLLDAVRTRLLEEYPAYVRECLDVIDEEQLWWRPHEASNAIGNLLLHVAGSNRFYLAHVIGGAPNVRDRDAEFAMRGGVTRAEIARTWDDVTVVARDTLATMSPARLLEPTERGGRLSTVTRVLMHVTHHNMLHIGQVIWMTKMLAPGTINELMQSRAR